MSGRSHRLSKEAPDAIVKGSDTTIATSLTQLLVKLAEF
jgi:hypothetical protein